MKKSYQEYMMYRIYWILIILGLPIIIDAQPSNDFCEDAISIISTADYCSGEGEFTNVDAIQDVPATSCFTSNGKDVWFKFVSTTEAVRISVSGQDLGGTLNLPLIKMYENVQCGDSADELMCASSGNFQSLVSMDVGGLTIGETYFFIVRGKNNAEGTFQLCVNNFDPIENDQCAGAIDIPITDDLEFCLDVSNERATGGLRFSSCFTEDGQDIWFKFTALNEGIRASIKGIGQGGTVNRPEISLHPACPADEFSNFDCVPGNLSQIASLDVAGLTRGDTYFLRVQGRNGSQGTMQLCLENYAPPENDLCINAINLPNVDGYCSADGEFSNMDAGKEIITSNFSCLSEEGSDVWFRFRAVYPTIKINVGGRGVGGSILRPELELFRSFGCDPNFGNAADILACSAAQTNNEASIDIGGLIPGDNYYIRVQGRRGEIGDFRLCVDNIPGPSNDNCISPIVISDVNNFCSEQRAFSNIDAGFDENMQDIISCLDRGGKDVWFSFIAEGTDVVITAIGATGGNFPGGSLENPEVELFFVDECNVAMTSFPKCGFAENNLVNLKLNGLQRGREYLIRVQGENGGSGTFQLCVNSFNPNFPPESDCGDARLLCDKSPVYVEVQEGAGDDPNEAANTCLDAGSINSEQKSSWYKWRAANSEELTFVLTPDFNGDDLDWVLYELPNGFENCGDKVAIRCMASGSNGGDFSSWRVCVGPTGLRVGEDDVNEDAGCNNGFGENDDNAFLAPIILREGMDYALLVNFFDFENSSTGQTGFTIEFDGPGEFQGITTVAEITTDANPVCAGDEILFDGSSSSFVFGQDAISDYEWFFGSGATPTSATGVGPHAVLYNSPGEKNVSLTVVSEEFGCQSEELVESIVDIQSCCNTSGSIESTTQSTDEICNDANGTINMAVASNFPYQVQWNTGSKDEDLSDLEDGAYVAIVTNTAECSDTVVVVVNDIIPSPVIPTLTIPTCNGGEDGAIDLNVGSDFTITWENPDSTRTQLTNLPEGDYAVTIVDDMGCQQDMIIRLEELKLELDPDVQTLRNPSCNGVTDGAISLGVSNGVAPYFYLWEGDSIGVDQSNLTNLPGGDYKVDIVDDNNCRGELQLKLVEPDPILLDVMASDVSCAGQGDGSVSAAISGGAGGYMPVWTPTISNFMQVDTGTYQLVVTDRNGCENDTTIQIIEPNQIFLDLDEVEDVVCAGFETGVIRVTGSGGNPAYEYSVNGTDFQNSNIIEELPAGIYTVTIRDELGCSTILTDVEIEEPEALGVAIYADDITVDLGKSTTLEADVISGSEDVRYEWSPPVFVECVDCPETEVSPVLPTDFVVTITDAIGCTAVDSVFLIVDPQRELYIPTAFSPGFDGINDRFTLYGGTSTEEIRLLRIFDRWGNLLFEESGFSLGDPSTGWDGMANGELMPAGVYAFYAVVAYIDGEEIAFEGDVTIVR